MQLDATQGDARRYPLAAALAHTVAPVWLLRVSLLRAPDRGGPGNVCTGDTTGYVGYKTFDQMAGELKA